jgi:soluble lytic murein transglycosylase-like protein
MRSTRQLIQLLMLATTCSLSCAVWAPTAPAGPESAAATAQAGPPAVDADFELVHAQLRRYAHRSGLTYAELERLARTVVEEARRHRVEPRLVLAVMHVESRYNAFAVSDQNAMGLMQMLPSTGEWLAPQVGVAWSGPQTLFDPISNVRLGVAYLRQLLDRYDDNLDAALAAYNWGPGHIDGRLRQGTPLPVAYVDLVQRAYGRGAQRS